ncbi:MAG: hypothetical protein U0871_00945 [Gemmataceae bacterium]
MGLPFEATWVRAANQRLLDYYGLPGPSGPEQQDGIDRFVRVEARSRVFDAIGHKYVCELQQRLTDNPETRRMSRAEWRAFLEVPESTLSRWRHDQNLAGAQYFFAVHQLRLNLPLGAVPLPPPDVMLKAAVVSLLRHLRIKYLGIDERPFLAAATVDHLVNLMLLMGRDPRLVYNPHGEAAERANLTGLARYATALFNRRHAGRLAGLSEAEIADGVGRLTAEARLWLDQWGLAYTLLAVGYRDAWQGVGGTG